MSALPQQPLINPEIAVLEDVENHLFHADVRMLVQPLSYRPNCNSRRLVRREHEYARGDTAKSNTTASLLRRSIQTDTVALRQLLAVFLHQEWRHDRTDNVNDIVRRQGICRRDHRNRRRLHVIRAVNPAKRLHLAITFIPKLHPGHRMDDVPDTCPVASFVCVFLLLCHFHGSESHTN